MDGEPIIILDFREHPTVPRRMYCPRGHVCWRIMLCEPKPKGDHENIFAAYACCDCQAVYRLNEVNEV